MFCRHRTAAPQCKKLPFISTSRIKKSHVLFSGLLKVIQHREGDDFSHFWQVTQIAKSSKLTAWQYFFLVPLTVEKEPKVRKIAYQKMQMLLNTVSCNQLPLGREGACQREQAGRSILVSHLGIKALIRFQFLPWLLTSWDNRYSLLCKDEASHEPQSGGFLRLL